jgi:peptide/nickel transport system substrate-binding protein
MLSINRRSVLGLLGATAGTAILPRIAMSQGKRSSVTEDHQQQHT